MKEHRPETGCESSSCDDVRRLLETQNQELIVQQKQLLAASDQLEILNEKLKLADQMKSEFVSMVVHEIRNPLASVSQSIEVARDLGGAELPGKTRHYLDVAQRNVWRLNRILSDLLDLAKMEAGKLVIELDVVDPADAVAEAASFSQADAENAKLALSVEGAGLAPVLADANRLTQVLGNLISNAIKYTPAGGSVTVAAAAVEGGVRFSVVDTGKGVAKEFQQAIFEKYRQLASYQGGGKRGTGLGLPICRNLISLHGGTIAVESEPGKGARFSFEIARYSVAGRLRAIAAQFAAHPPVAAWRLAVGGGEAWKTALAMVKRAIGEGEWQVVDPARGRIWVLSAAPDGTKRHVGEAVKYLALTSPPVRIDLPGSADVLALMAVIDKD
jgi:signal transduction histidine kinase